jgi:hypothetical protein
MEVLLTRQERFRKINLDKLFPTARRGHENTFIRFPRSLLALQKTFQRTNFFSFRRNCTALVAVTSLTLDSARAAGSESLFGKEFARRFLLRRKKIVLLCRTVEFKILLHNVNRAQHNRRIPKYTKSSISQQLNSTFTQAPSASRRDAAAGIS